MGKRVDDLFKFLDIKKLKTVSISATAFMLAAYMYAYTNSLTLFDAARLYRGAESVNFASDKWAISFLGLLDAHVNEPWLAGLWTVIFMIVSVYFITDVLEINSTWGICLAAGLCSTQSSIICQQGYIGGQYTGEAALAFACLAAWLFLKSNIEIIWKMIFGAMCIAVSAGIYGAYISMVPSLMILSLIMDIVYKEKSARETWGKAILSVGQFLIGMILYYAILRIGVHFTESELQSYMGEDSLSSVQQVIEKHNYIAEAYEQMVRYYLGRVPIHYLPKNLERMALISLLIGIGLSIITLLRYRKRIADRKYNIALLLGLLLVLPLSLNLIYVFASGNVHQLMIFTYVLPYVFFVKLMEMEISVKERCRTGYLISVLYKISACVFVYYSVVMANATFVQLNHLYVNAQSAGTRLLDRIESCEGFDGTETIYLVGNILYNEYFTIPVAEAEILDANLGHARPDLSNALNATFLTNILDARFRYAFNGSIEELTEELAEDGVDEAIIKEIKQMPAFPYDGSVQKLGEDIYVIFTTDEMRKEYSEKYGL